MFGPRAAAPGPSPWEALGVWTPVSVHLLFHPQLTGAHGAPGRWAGNWCKVRAPHGGQVTVSWPGPLSDGGGTLTSVQPAKCRLEISLKIEEANAPPIITTEGQRAGREPIGLRLCSSQPPLAAALGSGSVFRGRR